MADIHVMECIRWCDMSPIICDCLWYVNKWIIIKLVRSTIVLYGWHEQCSYSFTIVIISMLDSDRASLICIYCWYRVSRQHCSFRLVMDVGHQASVFVDNAYQMLARNAHPWIWNNMNDRAWKLCLLMEQTRIKRMLKAELHCIFAVVMER
jgi:hypothetical protein